MKRIISCILTLIMAASLLMPAMPAPASAATSTEDIRAAVTRAYDELLSTLNPGEGSGEGVMQLVNHAMSGGGADLIMDESDYFTGMVFHANMFRDSFLDNMTAVFNKLVHNYDEKILLHSSLAYYDHLKRYTGTVVSEFVEYRDVNEIRDENYDAIINDSILERLVRVENYSGAFNTYDNGMILVTGGAVVHYTIERMSSSQNIANYRVSMRYQDNFDITNMDYSGKEYDRDDVKLANALSLLGKLMEIGGIFDPYHYEIVLDFDISFNNDCPHETENFRWEYNGTDIAEASGNGLTVNPSNRVDQVSSTTGETLPPYYELDKTVKLHHNLPWTVEFRMKGTKPFIMAPTVTYGVGNPYLLKTHDHVLGGEGFRYTEINEETSEEVTKIGRNQYGVEFTKYGYTKTPWYTFRLENRINADGSNTPYLFVDGTELGPMTSYFINKDSVNYDQNQTVDWFNGREIFINYIFNQSFRFWPDISIEYIQIWENGDTNAPYSYYTISAVAPTCTGKGYTAHVCSQCGDTWKDNFVDPLGHSYTVWSQKDENLHSRACTVCGEEAVDVHSFSDGTCTVCDYVSTASVKGSWTTDFTFAAADLGVSAPDSVIRATLTFGEDGTASANWEAVDLTAMRLYFHDMFVNAYYALAYGMGITDLNEVEQFCMDSTGMSVSAYMDTIVTEEAIAAAFTPAPTTGTYTYNHDHTAIFTDLAILGVESDPTVENSFVVGNDTLYLNAASYGKSDYTFVCTRR